MNESADFTLIGAGPANLSLLATLLKSAPPLTSLHAKPMSITLIAPTSVAYPPALRNWPTAAFQHTSLLKTATTTLGGNILLPARNATLPTIRQSFPESRGANGGFLFTSRAPKTKSLYAHTLPLLSPDVYLSADASGRRVSYWEMMIKPVIVDYEVLHVGDAVDDAADDAADDDCWNTVTYSSSNVTLKVLTCNTNAPIKSLEISNGECISLLPTLSTLPPLPTKKSTVILGAGVFNSPAILSSSPDYTLPPSPVWDHVLLPLICITTTPVYNTSPSSVLEVIRPAPYDKGIYCVMHADMLFEITPTLVSEVLFNRPGRAFTVLRTLMYTLLRVVMFLLTPLLYVISHHLVIVAACLMKPTSVGSMDHANAFQNKRIHSPYLSSNSDVVAMRCLIENAPVLPSTYYALPNRITQSWLYMSSLAGSFYHPHGTLTHVLDSGGKVSGIGNVYCGDGSSLKECDEPPVGMLIEKGIAMAEMLVKVFEERRVRCYNNN
jgi:hypothetical protein